MKTPYQFKIKVKDTPIATTISCGYDVFSPNMSLICKYIAELKGELSYDTNTAILPSVEGAKKFYEKLLNLTIPAIL